MLCSSSIIYELQCLENKDAALFSRKYGFHKLSSFSRVISSKSVEGCVIGAWKKKSRNELKFHCLPFRDPRFLCQMERSQIGAFDEFLAVSEKEAKYLDKEILAFQNKKHFLIFVQK